jgi:cytochrome c553
MAGLSWRRLRGWQRVGLALPVLVLVIWACALAYLQAREAWEPSKLAYQEHCAGCHGKALEGSDSAPSLLGGPLTLINDYESLMAAMSGGEGAPSSARGPRRICASSL